MRSQIWIGLFAVLMLFAVVATFRTMGKASRGYDRARQRRVAAGPGTPCSTCASPLKLVGVADFRVTPADAAVAEALGVLDGSAALEVHRCPTCRKVELFLPPSAG
jgi:hypothetical protein